MRLDCPQRAYLPPQRFTNSAKYSRRSFDKRRGFCKGTGHRIAHRKALNIMPGLHDSPFQFSYGFSETEKLLQPRILSINTQAAISKF
jgi:hypothetical protein